MPEIGKRYSYKDCPTLEDFASSHARLRGVMGPFGSGKSSAMVAEIMNRARAQAPGPDGIRHTRWAVIRNTYSELKLTTMATVFQWLPPAYCGREYVADHRYVLNREPNLDCEIIFLALDRPQDISKLLSLELTGAWVNEAREVPWAIIEALQGRIGRWPSMTDGGPTWSGIFMDTNPPDNESEWYKFFEEGKWREDLRKMIEAGELPPGTEPDEFVQLFKQPDGLGPDAENTSNLKDGRRYYVNLALGKTAEFVKVYCRGDYGFVMDGKLVFPDYNDRIHCQDIEPREGLPVYRGWDFGLTPACVFSQVLPDGRWLIFAEMCATSMGIERFADEVLEHCVRSFPPGTRFIDVGDPAGEQRAQTDERTCFEIMWAKKIEITAGEQSPTIRQESVRKPMRTLQGEGAQFVLHSRCKTVRKGFQGGYHFRRMQVAGTERYGREPEKNRFSHPHDALQYVATRLFAAGLTRPEQGDDDLFNHTDDAYADVSIRNSVTGYIRRAGWDDLSATEGGRRHAVRRWSA